MNKGKHSFVSDAHISVYLDRCVFLVGEPYFKSVLESVTFNDICHSLFFLNYLSEISVDCEITRNQEQTHCWKPILADYLESEHFELRVWVPCQAGLTDLSGKWKLTANNFGN